MGKAVASGLMACDRMAQEHAIVQAYSPAKVIGVMFNRRLSCACARQKAAQAQRNVTRHAAAIIGLHVLTFCFASQAMAIDPGCYSADVVRNATWLSEGKSKQYTIISGLHNVRRNPVYLTSNDDGSEGYSLEKEGNRICITGRYADITTNRDTGRPLWLNVPKGSDNDRYISYLEKTQHAKVIYGATSIVRISGQEYRGAKVVFVEASAPIEGLRSGSLFTNTKSGKGDGLFVMVSEGFLTNSNYDALYRSQHQ